MAKTYDEYLLEADKKTSEARKKDLAYVDSSADNTIKLAKDTYNKSINDTEIEYESAYERNAVQKLINEKQVAERNADLGLTDSGLNRTQQTAVQLSYANQKGKIDISRQQALDELSNNLVTYVTEVNNKREADKMSVNQYYDQQNSATATSLYNTDVENEYKKWEQEQQIEYDKWKAELDANTALAKEQISMAAKQPTVSYGAGGTTSGGYIISNKNGLLSRDYYGSLKDNGVDTVYSYNKNGTIKSVTYTDNNSGMSASFEAGVNPYTGKMHDDLRDKDGKYDPSKAFKSNGYQPNNIDGKSLKATKAKGYIYPGLEQTIFECDGKAYLWDGGKGKYVQVTGEAFKEAFPSGKIE